jgi:hypothetical protein
MNKIHEQISDFENRIEGSETGISSPEKLYELITRLHELADDCQDLVLSDDEDCYTDEQKKDLGL